MSIVRFHLGDVTSMVRASRGVNPEVPTYLGVAIGYAGEWARHNEPHAVDHDPTQSLKIDAVMRKVLRSPPEKCLERTYEGIFFPALLMFSGWWARKNRRTLADAQKWEDGLQHWLFRGLEQWGPSLQVQPDADQADGFLFGQIGGEGDEADLVALIVAASKAGRLRDVLAQNGPHAFPIRATGRLCHRSHVSSERIKLLLQLWGKAFQYCLIVDDGDPTHGVEPQPNIPSFYSGYLWKCVLPKKSAVLRDDEATKQPVLKAPLLHDVFFLWEHTDLTKSDTIAYNLDSLSRKEEYLRKRLGESELILLQKSSDLIEGVPAMPTEKFYAFINNA